jgi:predicted 2-oxoglutarate/Fe(II)-dependent dioxygenase YbiX
MKKIIIKENFIYKFENLVEDYVCDKILDFYTKNHSNDLNDTSKLPWFENNIIYYGDLMKTDISNEIKTLKEIITKCVETSYGETVYSNVSTLVMWKEGKSMGIHKDNGYEHDKEMLHMRKYSAVFYVNDDYEGGETIVLKENSQEPEIVYKAKKSSLLLFRSDESCLHGVKTVKKGNRLTFAVWFTTDENHKEN